MIYKHNLRLFAAVVAIGVAISASAQAPVGLPDPSIENIITNPSIETPPNGPEPLPAEAFTTGWLLLGGDVFFADASVWTPADGDHSLELNGIRNGAVESSSFVTIPGQAYRVSFSLSGDPVGGDPIKGVMYNVVGASGDNLYSAETGFDVSGSTPAAMAWDTISFLVTADGGSSKLQFYSLENGTSGPVIDNVSVTAEYSGSTDAVVAVSATAGVLCNDSDPNGDPISVTSFDATSALGATVTMAADGSFSYDPSTSATLQALGAGSSLSDTFTYTPTDGLSPGTATTVTVNMASGIEPPVANNDTFSTDEDTVLNEAAPGVLLNDTDVGVGPLLVVAHDAISLYGATVTVNPNGDFSYDPTPSTMLQGLPPGTTVFDEFMYTIENGDADQNSAIVTIEVTGVNNAPIAVDDIGAVDADTTLVVTAAGVLGNDIDDVIEILPITNASFEDPDAPDALEFQPTAWAIDPLFFNANLDPTNLAFAGTDGDNVQGPLKCGGQVGFVQDFNFGSPTATSITQDTGVATQPNTTYTLLVYIGQRLDLPMDYRVEVLDGTVPIISADNPLVPAPGTFDLLTLAGTTGAAPTGNVIVRFTALDTIAALNTRSVFDCVTLTGAPAATPLLVSSADTTSALGATVSVQSDGSYTYDPSTSATLQGLAGGAQLNDTFDYNISDGTGGADTATVTITVTGVGLDATPPTITCPPPITVEADESTGTATTGTAVATDDIDPSPVVTHSDSVTGCSPTIITRTQTATDANNNTAQCIQIITQNTLTCPDVADLVFDEYCGQSDFFTTVGPGHALFIQLLADALANITVCDDGSAGSSSNSECHDHILAIYEAFITGGGAIVP